jgi:hypothetical protein
LLASPTIGCCFPSYESIAAKAECAPQQSERISAADWRPIRAGRKASLVEEIDRLVASSLEDDRTALNRPTYHNAQTAADTAADPFL